MVAGNNRAAGHIAADLHAAIAHRGDSVPGSRRRSGLARQAFRPPGLPWRQRVQLAQDRTDDVRLLRQPPIEGLIAVPSIDDVPGATLDQGRDVRGRVPGKQHGDELGADRTGVIQQLPDDLRLPDDAQPPARRLVAADPAVIALGADHQHEVGGLDLSLAP